jgi:ribosomal protein S12 methylthiotransferase accessory factor YcaO
MSRHAHGLIAVNVVIESDSYPFFMTGAAASTSLPDAVSRAFREAERQLCGLLQGHSAQTIETMEVSSCADHGTLYAGSRAETDKLTWLWSGGFTTSTPDTTSVTLSQLMTKLGAIVVRLSPSGACLDVVRVLSPELVPISFGMGHTYDRHPALGSTVDPASLQHPHYFP